MGLSTNQLCFFCRVSKIGHDWCYITAICYICIHTLYIIVIIIIIVMTFYPLTDGRIRAGSQPFRVKWMVSWALVDAVRELRFWSTASTSSCPWGVIILCGVILSCCCCGIGFILGSIVFSSIRKFLCQVLQLVCASWTGNTFGLDHRGRIAEYRRA